eukprot:TRINITY_DN1516_c0_g1_i4.p1 TRINITY_DN1516_c0_g1~~TRINITY_DN1516_c0_g1_i4.p1  ORF type:complete len:270 (-),score=30.61 TRINITY_DN1516_c0_g1_i4:28-837(-)
MLSASYKDDEQNKGSLGSMEQQLRQFLTQCSLCPRQTSLFSATVPPSVERLARSALINEIYLSIGHTWHFSKGQETAEERGLSLVPANITQNVLFVHTFQKKTKLLEVIRATASPPVLIFCDNIQNVDYVVEFLKSEQFHVAGLHSEKTQGYRFRVISAFRQGELDVLVATDVASRGLDISGIKHVIQYDLPHKIETYIHRVGRTGRAGEPGEATCLLTYHCRCAKELKRLLKITNQVVPRQLQEETRLFGGVVVTTELGDKVIPEASK